MCAAYDLLSEEIMADNVYLQKQSVKPGNKPKKAYTFHGLTQQELADQSGVSVKTIRNIETGKMNPSYEILFPIINRLGLSREAAMYREMEGSFPAKKYLFRYPYGNIYMKR